LSLIVGGNSSKVPVVTLAQLTTTFLSRDNYPGFCFCSDSGVMDYLKSTATQWKKFDGTVVSTDPLLNPLVWSPGNTTASLVLTNSNRTAAWAATGFGAAGTRAYTGKSTGKWAWEVVADLSTTDSLGVGVSNAGFDDSIKNSTYTITGSPNALGWAGTAIKYNGTSLATMPAIATGDVIQQAMDLDADLYWARKVGGLWNNSATADPVTGVGGLSMAGLGTGPIYPAATLYNSANAKVTSRFAAAEMSVQVSGFSAFG
jgi:hypothetical protein